MTDFREVAQENPIARQLYFHWNHRNIVTPGQASATNFAISCNFTRNAVKYQLMTKKLSIIIPVYNEAATIESIVQAVQNQSLEIERELVIVDDCSTDDTRAKLEQIALADNVRIFRHEVNQGKGAALRTGFAQATGDIVIVQDADLEYDPADYPKMIAPILAGDADVVYGSRFAGGASHAVLRYWHAMGNRFLTRLSNWFSDLWLTDMETCYKCFRREVIQSIEIEENRFGFEPEITAKLAAAGVSVWEVQISYRGRGFHEGKKIGAKDGFRAIWAIVKYNMQKSRNRKKYQAKLAELTAKEELSTRE